MASRLLEQREIREVLRAAERALVGIDTQATIARAIHATIGELTIPRVHLSAMVLHGSDSRTLRRGPGHIEHTALPGQAGNVAIAGHRDSFFRPVRDVRVGDDIYFATREGRFHYRVESLDIVRPDDMSVLDETEAPTLTLVTCFPFWVAGSAPDRFVVRAYEVDRAGTAAPLRRTTETASIDASVGVEPSVV